MAFSTALLLWLAGYYLYHFRLAPVVSQTEVASFERKYNKQHDELQSELKDVVSIVESTDDEDEQFRKITSLAKNDPNDYFYFRDDTLRVWTSNSIPLPHTWSDSIVDSEVVRLANGWYSLATEFSDSGICAGLFLIKSQFPYENEDLVNEFSPELSTSLYGEIHFEDSGLPVHNKAGERIFSVQSDPQSRENEHLEILIFFCYLLSILIFLQLLINAFEKLLNRNPIILIAIPAIIVVSRYIWLWSEFNGIFGDFELFNPELFASSTLAPSLGDLIINVSIFYFLVHFLLRRTKNWFKEGNRRLKLVFFLVPLFLISFITALQINDIINSLVFNSKISFDLEKLFDLTAYSVLSITIIGASFYAYFKLIQYIIIQLRKNGFELNKLAFLWTVTSGIYILFDQFRFDHSLLTSFWPIILSGSLLWFEYREKTIKFFHVISMIAFISFYAAHILQDYSEMNERNIRELLAEHISKDKDPTSELDYDNAQRKLLRDSVLLDYLNTEDFYQRGFNEEMQEKYFDKLTEKYDLQFYLFDSNKSLLYDFRSYTTREFNRQQEIIDESGTKSGICENLYFVKDFADKLNYIAELPIVVDDSIVGYLFSEFRSKKFPEDLGLPSLLLDSRVHTIEQLKNYSMAKYADKVLVTSKGDFNYPTLSTSWIEKTNRFCVKEEYSHYIYEEEPGYITVISRPVTSSLVLLTSFSYLLIIFGVLLLVPLAYEQLQKGVSFRSIKLNVRIQVVLVGLTLTTLVAFAIGAGTFVVQQKYESNKDLIKEKIGSVSTELEGKLKKYEELKALDSYYLEYLLQKFSIVFVTDINLYNKQGQLLASSQPKIFSKGLLSEQMNANAYQAIHLENKKEFINEEQIGRLNYLSAYTAFRNQKGEYLAYLNVQYISRQDELESQISGFLLAIINIMVLMLTISTILSITISNNLTRPLKAIQERLKTVQIGSVSKPIEYEGTDEIGELVKEYNKMVDELQKNAEKLAKSERESAWREMAKQVAHEIKNPLTPMKLSIQHLKRSVNVSDEDSKEKLDKVSNSLIEQIDALTQIANEFSNFAKMPKAEEAELNLVDVVKSAAAVFSEDDQYEFEVDIPMSEAMIWADKDLLLRVFNNLIKNATQAIPVGEEGKVKIGMSQENGGYKVWVKDNGVGIKEEEQERIFVPYFTTKSTGTGLGLAMSKQIVEGMAGEIWFESKVGEGTTFYVSFPKYER